MDYEAGTPVLVTTEFRGVFFGYLKAITEDHTKITLEKARNCSYWSADVRGFIGLASDGPSEGCRIGPAGPEITLLKVTSICKVTPGAVEKWEAAPWK